VVALYPKILIVRHFDLQNLVVFRVFLFEDSLL
jgi:hypothetical protein